MAKIANSAIVDDSCKLADDVEIGPYAIIHPNVVVGAGTKIHAHAVIHSNTTLGQNNVVHSFACLGTNPQVGHHKSKAVGSLSIGSSNVFHEFVTISRGCDDNATTIGNKNLFQAYSHVGHDAKINNHIVMVNHSAVAGHVTVSDYAIIGAYCAVHQFCHVGQSSMISHGALVSKDVMPYVIVVRNPARTCGLNKVGLKRRGFSDEALKALKIAYKAFFRGSAMAEVGDEIMQIAQDFEPVHHMIECYQASQRGIVR